MENWLLAVNKFLKDWENKDYVLGALVCGSFVTGNATPNSDIDLHIILSDKTNWRERGNKIVDGFLIEYFANPPKQHNKYEEGDYACGTRTNARMFATGKIIFDKTGVIKKIQNRSRKIMIKKLKKLDKNSVEMMKYSIWDFMDGLKDLKDTKSFGYNLCYYNTLETVIKSYAKISGIELPPISKLYKFLNDGQFRKKYNITGFIDKEFIKLTNECLDTTKFSDLNKLANYVLDKMGGFAIDGWKARTKLDV